MAALKLFVFALLATSAFSKDDFLDVKIEKAIKNFVDEGQKSLESSIADFSGELLESLEGLLSFLQFEGLPEIGDEWWQFLSEVSEDLVDLAGSEDGLQECLQQSQPRLQALIQKAREQLQKCGQGSLTELEDLFNRALEEFNKSGDRLAAIYDEFEACKDLTCKVQVGRKLLEEIFNVQIIAKDMMVEFINLIKQSLPEVRECIAAAAPELREELKQIVSDVKKCVAGQ